MDRKAAELSRMARALENAKQKEDAAKKAVAAAQLKAAAASAAVRLIEAKTQTLLAESHMPEPHYLLDLLMKLTGARNDAELARRLQTYPGTISKVRSNTLPVSAPLMIAMHEETGLKTLEIKALIAHGPKANVNIPAAWPRK